MGRRGLERQLATALGSVFESDYAERRECLKNFELRISVALGKMGSSQIDHIPALSKACRCQFPARGLQEAIEHSILHYGLFLDSALWVLPYEELAEVEPGRLEDVSIVFRRRISARDGRGHIEPNAWRRPCFGTV